MRHLEALAGIDHREKEARKLAAKNARTKIEEYQQSILRDTKAYKDYTTKPTDPIEGAKSHIELIRILGSMASDYFRISQGSHVRWEPWKGFGLSVERFEYEMANGINGQGTQVAEDTLWYDVDVFIRLKEVTPALIDELAAKGKGRLLASLGNQTQEQIINKFLGAIR